MQGRRFTSSRFSAVTISERRKEGFYPLRSFEAGYPEPRGWDQPEAALFLADLDLVQPWVHDSAKLHQRRRPESCWLCQARISSRELIYRGWTWLEGLRHYVAEHQVKPSQEFRDLIEVEAALLRTYWREAPPAGDAAAGDVAPAPG